VVTMLSLLERIAGALERIAGVLSEARNDGCMTVSVDEYIERLFRGGRGDV